MSSLNNTLSFMISLCFLFFLTVTTSTAFTPPLQSQFDSIPGDILCGVVGCGQGTCNTSVSNPPFFFDCDCYPGWTKVKIKDLVFPPCILPNCSINFNCGLPAFSPPINLNLTNPCDLIWCGDGTCEQTNRGGHACVCNNGSSNLNNSAELPCFKECALGADCVNVGLGPPPPPPALLQPPPPTPSKGSAGGKGFTTSGMKNGNDMDLDAVAKVLLAGLRALEEREREARKEKKDKRSAKLTERREVGGSSREGEEILSEAVRIEEISEQQVEEVPQEFAETATRKRRDDDEETRGSDSSQREVRKRKKIVTTRKRAQTPESSDNLERTECVIIALPVVTLPTEGEANPVEGEGGFL
ncbi:hypothetical protein J5N97_003978 [Dioscorea zingiberensis]|uniref:Uncharacterized protein n=1 Tax=Dioscorea zingiberensis TaxID=325984 RepID=A0A9D5HRP0_9LILI|nr:hypothetical protein J5N97_003978 [Dioscorea zingiberensis]